MKTLLSLIFCAVVILASCSKTDNGLLSTSPGKNSPELRQATPFKGTLVFLATTDFDLACDCGTYFPTANYFGTGHLTHLGLTTSKAKGCIAPVYEDSVLVGFHVNSLCTSLVAANGDELYVSAHPYDLTINSDGIAIASAIADIIGGTGKFVNATGSFVTHEANNLQGTITTDFDGTINY